MPPTRGHDLKHCEPGRDATYQRDAPHTGARLETRRLPPLMRGLLDAPHTGARLETADR